MAIQRRGIHYEILLGKRAQAGYRSGRQRPLRDSTRSRRRMSLGGPVFSRPRALPFLHPPDFPRNFTRTGTLEIQSSGQQIP